MGRSRGKKCGRPKKGEEWVEQPTRSERQKDMALEGLWVMDLSNFYLSLLQNNQILLQIRRLP